MGILDFLALPGQERTRLRDEYLGGLLNYYLGPTGIPQRLGLVDMMNPVSDVGRAMTSSQEMLAPGRTPMERVGAGATMLADMASVAAPAAATRIAGGDATQAVVEGLLGTPMAVEEAGRRVVERLNQPGPVPTMYSNPLGRAGVQSTDPAAERGAEIMQMLRSGRASEITEDMLDMGDPVLNARLNMYLFENYDLPMDEASRMARARESGFDTGTPLYRGDQRPDLQRFDTGLYAREGIGVTTSRSPNVAATYMLGDQPAMYSVVSRSQNPLTVEAGGRSWSGISPDAPANQSSLDNLMDLEDYLDEENLFDFINNNTVDWGDGTQAQLAVANTNDISRAAQEYGFDEVRFNNLIDRGGAGRYHTGPANDPHTTVMTADPANIRSRFARFDPRLAHLRNLSAGVGGLGLLATQMPEQQRDEEIRQYLGGLL